MIKYNSLKSRIMPVVLAAGLTALFAGYVNKSELIEARSTDYKSNTNLEESQITTNQLLGLWVDDYGRSYALYEDQEGKTKTVDYLPIKRDLPPNSKIVIILNGSEGAIHLQSNSPSRIAKF